MNTTNDGGLAEVHPMVMKAAKSWFASEVGVSAADDPEEWDAQSAVQIRRAQAALTECGALECLEALELIVAADDTGCLWERDISRGKLAIYKARDVSSAGSVYGSAPE